MKERSDDEKIGEEKSLEFILAELLHYSKLIHLDISGSKMGV